MSQELYKSYDRIADQYDEHYTAPVNLQENAELAVMIGRLVTSETRVLDIGCGTGLVLDLVDIPPENYVGIDPSHEMLAKLREKHPEHTAIESTYEDYEPDTKFDVALAIFSGHYLDDEAKAHLAERADKYLYMFAKPDYAPSWYYTPEEQEVSRHLTDYDKLGQLFKLEEWHDYLIAYKQ